MALEAGKHVLCEKPMAINVEEALAMQAAADQNGKVLMIGFVRRFGRDCRVVTDLIENDRLGDIYYAKAQYLRRNGNPGGWFGNTALSGGGPLIDLGVHSIDLIRYLMGRKKVISVYGATFEKLGNRAHIKTGKGYRSSSTESGDICDCEDLAAAMIRFEDGSVLNVEVSFSLNIGGAETNTIQLFGTKAGVTVAKEIRMFSELDGYLTDTEVGKDMSFDFEASFTAEIAHFIACAKGETACRNPAEDGVEIMKILCAIYRSAKSGHEEVLA
jgi:predicted dehydrogenase